MTPMDFDRFTRKISTPREAGGCWIWTASATTDGYGTFRLNGRSQRAHRVSYVEYVGPIPAEKPQLDHLCRNRRCVRPDHLEPVTNQENADRGEPGKHNAIKTHCPKGHEYTPENTRITRRGWRNCLACDKARGK